MNNFQNSFGKCFSPPTTVANHHETFNKNKLKSETTARPIGALKIFYESKNFNSEEPVFGRSLTGSKKKSSRSKTLGTSAERKKKDRKNEKEFKYEEGTREELFKRPCFLTNEPKVKSRGFMPKSGQNQEISFTYFSLNKTDWSRNHEIAQKYFTKTELERAPTNDLFTLSKPKAENKVEKLETTAKCREISVQGNKSLTQKASDKLHGPSDMKITISDSGKRRINEILKSHAQKVHSTPPKTLQARDIATSGSEAHKKSEDVKESAPKPATKVEKSENVKEPVPKNLVKNEKNEEPKPETDKNKIREIDFKGSKESKPSSRSKTDEDKAKKVSDQWMKLPQSSELERRLKNTWLESGSHASAEKEVKADKTGEKVAEEVPTSNSSEKEQEKRVTYTDRLLLLKMVGRNLDEKKRRITFEEEQQKDQSAQGKPLSKENSESLTKNQEAKPLPVPIQKEVTLCVGEDKSLASLKDGRTLESENIFKAKESRSAELRDLVAHAIKDHKIFCIFDNHTYIVRPVREELLNRGWLEVIPDRRLIPRRRPPPMGPVYERDRALTERNCNALEAVLVAKETFANEIQETFSRSPIKIPIERSGPMGSGLSIKKSEDSLSEVLSQFRIIPPTAEKKKNNFEIREFLARQTANMEKEKEKEKVAKEKENKKSKKDKHKTPVQEEKKKVEEKPVEMEYPVNLRTKSVQEIWDTINDNKRLLMQAANELRNVEGGVGGELTIGVMYGTMQKKESSPEVKKTQEAQEEQHHSPKPKPGSTGRHLFTDSEAKAISKIIQSSNARIHFMWLSIKPAIHLKCFNYSPEIVNKFQKTTFCTKIGLWSHLNNMQWYAHEVNFPAKSPRMYNTGEADDMQAFYQDFRLTACLGMLKWLADTFFEKGLRAVQTKRGKVPLRAFEFAIKQCEKYIRFKENEEINMPEEPAIQQEEWNTFLQWFYIITNDHGKVQESSSAQLMVVYTKAVETLKVMKHHWPEMDIDGRLNIWIMKPYCASCGRGIFMTNNVYYISQHSKYIVQKYIEKPLLIYNTKFDIRQWFMITKLTPLEIWMYKECYLRFCSQPFALRNLHESVHLSNNSVQRKYISLRDPNLPDQNMWDSSTFQLYLKTIGYPTVWEDIIYPGMRDAIVSTMLASQDTFDGPRKSWFEVYGADFMLSANVKEGPWLIEINENPAMDPSTKITARLCPQMLRDVIKVVVDKRANKNANTGQWELVYRQNYTPSFGTVDLDVKGKKISKAPCTTKLSFHVSQGQPKIGKHYTESTLAGPGRVYEFVKSLEALKRSKRTVSTRGQLGNQYTEAGLA